MMTFVFGIFFGVLLAVAALFIGFVIFHGGKEQEKCECEKDYDLWECDTRYGDAFPDLPKQPMIAVGMDCGKIKITIDKIRAIDYAEKPSKEMRAIIKVIRLVFGKASVLDGFDCQEFDEELFRDAVQFDYLKKNAGELERMAKKHNEEAEAWASEKREMEKDREAKFQRLLHVDTQYERLKEEHDRLKHELSMNKDIMAVKDSQIKNLEAIKSDYVVIREKLVPLIENRLALIKASEHRAAVFYEKILDILNSPTITSDEDREHGKTTSYTVDEASNIFGVYFIEHDGHTGSGPVG